MLEILAPCGGEECLDAALNAGADAIYLGLKSFSARKNAANFTEEQFSAAVDKAHRQGVKIYVPINTVIFDNEIPKLEKTVEFLAQAGADAVIVQDFAVARIISEIAPDLRLHASTQMTVTSEKGAEFAKRNGFSRVVLPRELSLNEIERIISSVDIETEVFVHGALCVCVSGQCLLSAALGGRSGNRGLCAQPCRLNYSVGERQNVLSLKDLSLIEQLSLLEKIGVTSAKIEGRMKRPEYVAASIFECRKALNGEKSDTELLRRVFSRSGFTDGYFKGTLDNMQGVRQKEDNQIPDNIKQIYKSPYKRFVLNFKIKIELDKPVCCTAECDGLTASVCAENACRAENHSLTREEVVERMSKLGGTIFNIGKIECEIGENIFVSSSSINDLRRRSVNKIEELIAQRTKISQKHKEPKKDV